jgi:hypothetical protein
MVTDTVYSCSSTYAPFAEHELCARSVAALLIADGQDVVDTFIVSGREWFSATNNIITPWL